MQLPFNSWIRNRRIVRFALLIILLCFTGSGLVDTLLHPGTPAAARSMLIGLIGGCAAGLLSIVLQFRSEVRPYTGALRLGESLNDEEMTNLTHAVTQLAQGNLSVRYNVVTEPVEATGSAEVDALLVSLNDMVRHLRGMSLEFNALTDVPCKRLCYVGADSFIEGQRCGDIMGNLLGGKGQVVISTGFFTATGLELRRKGFQSILREKFPDIEIVDIFENHESADLAHKRTMEMLAKHPRLSGIYTTEGGTPHAVARAVRESNQHAKVKIVGHDLTSDSVGCMKDQSIAALLGQDPFAQGHDPVILLFNHLVSGWQPSVPRLLTQMEVINPSNHNQFWETGRGLIQSPAAFERMPKPVRQKPEKPLRIAVLAREDTAFWTPVKNGALAAAQELKPFGVSVDWVVPEASRRERDYTAPVYNKALEELVEQGYHGIATIVGDRAMVPVINRVVEAGVPVITLNCEPLSLRSLIATIMAQAGRLMGMSEELAASTVEASSATSHINATMDEVARGTNQQNEQIKRTEADLESLLVNIDRINHEAAESASSAENTANAVNHGTSAMNQTLSSIRSIEHSVGNTWKTVNELGQQSDRIDVVVELIDDIASMVNVLALNASIEATRAGEAGKGFMVVANEIRRLAKRTAEATREVTELIRTVQSGVGGVQKAMEEGLDKARDSAGQADKAKALLSDIQGHVELNRTRMMKIAGAIGDMQRLSHQVGAAMENVASVSGRNSNSIEEVNVATKQLSDQFNDVAGLAHNLESIAQSQRELMAKFTVK